MNKRKKIGILLLFIAAITISGCGITEELEQAKQTVGAVDSVLKEQEKNYEKLADLIEQAPSAFEADMEEEPETGKFMNKEGDVYDNFQARQKLLKEMKAKEKEIIKAKTALEKVEKRKAADVDNEQLKLIIQSMDIVLSNFDSLEVYSNTGFSQEKEFYASLPLENMDEHVHIIMRTYGSIHMVEEEASANMQYTRSLIQTFEKHAHKSN